MTLAVRPATVADAAQIARVHVDTWRADLKGRGFPVVRLWVLDDNTPARRFYERYGFTPDGAHSAYQGIPELRYSLRLV